MSHKDLGTKRIPANKIIVEMGNGTATPPNMSSKVRDFEILNRAEYRRKHKPWRNRK